MHRCNQLSILHKLNSVFLKTYCEKFEIYHFSANNHPNCCVCGDTLLNKLQGTNVRACKVFINNVQLT